MITATRVREIFIALRLHFTTDYDYVMYNGKTRSIRDQGNTGFFFQNIAHRLFTEDAVRDFFIANMVNSFILEGEVNSFIGNYSHKDAYMVYKKWQSRKDSLVYYINEDLNKLIEHENDMKQWFVIPKNGHPIIFKLYSSRLVGIEILAYLDMALGFTKKWNTTEPDFILERFIHFLDKYIRLLSQEKPKILKILLDSFNKSLINI